jgi:2-desacetyl-2-hydroxyethyl bacteriochlorophyllide A dehydrogenase
MKRRSLYFTGTGVHIHDESFDGPAPGELLVRTLCSAISPGTEMLVYRCQVPRDMPVDETIPALPGTFSYPLKYGYDLVGTVVDVGQGLSPSWNGTNVFAFHPHESHFLAAPSELVPVPDGIDADDALFVPTMETALTLLMDGRPLVGEQVIVFGQGIVGLLTTTLLAHIPLTALVTVDRYPFRRQASLSAGAHAALDPDEPGVESRLQELVSPMGHHQGADLVYELSGSPAALDHAVAATGFSGRVVVGSWYGTKQVTLNLGTGFHRRRISVLSSQVSHIAPEFTGRWTTARRLAVVWDLIARLKPARLITHRYPFTKASEAYRMLDTHPEESLQTVLTYSGSASSEA